MKNFNPVSMTLNMPCQYITIDIDSSEILTGHFAFFDKDGTPYVWLEGGTSYTRASSFGNSTNLEEYITNNIKYNLVKCKDVFPLGNHNNEIYNHNMVQNFINNSAQ